MPAENNDPQLAAFWVEVALLRSGWFPSAATTASLVVSRGIVHSAVFFRDVAAAAACRVAAEDAFHCLATGTTVGGGVSDQRKLQRSLKNMCKEGAYWGTAAGVYVATESVVEEMRGCTDWKNAVIGGALAGALMSAAASAVRNDDVRSRGSKVVKDAIAGAAITAAAEFIGRRGHAHLLPPSTATVVSSKGGVIGQTRREAAAADVVDYDPWVSGSRGLELPLRFTTSTGGSSDYELSSATSSCELVDLHGPRSPPRLV
ncbi:hypothetical protein BS78_K241000 [Paspalum vaginatum]|uniref:Uncharacterized protein n=1 Tax=Paspalum vaginatum TaxID=158149 RepID=A0A9W8CF66_9POAL|nr:hypothetical protein BS78_K241000 [Paspalum vaginatum]